MLKGLEISELRYSQVQIENSKLRLDSAYFSKPMLDADFVARSYPGGFDFLGSLFSRFVKGVFDINAESYAEEGIPFLRITNLRKGVIDESNIARIPDAIHQAEKKTELKRGQIVLSKTAYPAASVVTLDRCNTSQDTIATTLSKYGETVYKPEAIVAYLNSKFGQQLLWRQFQGNVQLHLSLDDGRKVPIPKFCQELQSEIARVFRRSASAREDVILRLRKSEDTLQKALELSDWSGTEPLSYAFSSQSAATAKRLDAEFFSPRVGRLLKKLGRDGLLIADIAPSRHERFTPAKTGSFQYIEIGGMQGDGTVESELVPQNEAPSRATQIVRSNDVVTSTVRPIRRLSAMIAPSQDGHVCSSGFVVLQPKLVRPEVLLTYLRLPVVCELMDLYTSASLYPAISETDLLALPMPRVPEPAQREIALAVTESRKAKRRANQLLDAANRAIEIAIENSEDAALAYLKGATR